MADLIAVRAALKEMDGLARGLAGAQELLLALEDYEREAGARKDAIAKAEGDLKRLEERKSSLAGLLAGRKAVVDAEVAAVEKDARERKASALAETKRVLEGVAESVAAVNADLEAKRGQLAAVNAELVSARASLSELKTELSSLRSRIGLG